MNKKPTLKDVARHAGVSVATVSHVVNHTYNVSSATRELVLSSVEALNYRPDVMARSLKIGRCNLIAFVVPDIANAFFATLIEEVEQIVAEKGYRLLIMNTKETLERETGVLHALSRSIVDGLLLASTSTAYEQIQDVIPPDMPMVFLDRYAEDSRCDSVIIENYTAMYQGVAHLISLGHKKIGYISGLNGLSTTSERLNAYKAAMDAHGLYRNNLIREGTSMLRCAPAHVNSLLHEEKCTALVISNNVMTTEAMVQMLNAGIRPGKDVEILGYRDSDQPQYGLQHIHLIAQPTTLLGRTAGQQMLYRLSHPDAPVRQTVLQATFYPKGQFPL